MKRYDSFSGVQRKINGYHKKTRGTSNHSRNFETPKQWPHLPTNLSLQGRSALVTNTTKSARGIMLFVSSVCPSITAFVPGVSTRRIFLSQGTGRRNSNHPFLGTAWTWPFLPALSSKVNTWSCAVVGVTPSCRYLRLQIKNVPRKENMGLDLSPNRALIRLLLPLLNSPTTHNRKTSSRWSIVLFKRDKSSALASILTSCAYKLFKTERSLESISRCSYIRYHQSDTTLLLGNTKYLGDYRVQFFVHTWEKTKTEPRPLNFSCILEAMVHTWGNGGPHLSLAA